MLGWRTLTTRQRAACVFLVVVFLVGMPASIVFADTMSQRVFRVGAGLCFISAVLNPAVYAGPVSRSTSVKSMPAACRNLNLAGVGVIVAALVYHLVGIHHG